MADGLYKASVACAYQAEDDSELSIAEGQVVVVKEVNENGWCLVERGSDSGWVPHDYLERVAEDADIQGLANALNAVKAADQPAPASQGDCAKCSQPITNRYVAVKDKMLHADCFACTTCSMSLAGKPFIERDGGYYCEDDFYRKYNPPCEACNDVIKGKYITALGKTWHPDCFVCSDCQKPFTGSEFKKHEEHPYCNDCHNKSYGTHCSKCNKPIEGQIFEALDRKFHKECFTCEVDNHAIPETSTFHYFQDKVYCPEHFEQQFLQTCVECKQTIKAQYVKVGDDHFHPECWKCPKCSKQLERTAAEVVDGKFVCKSCAPTAVKDAVASRSGPAKAAPTRGTPAATKAAVKPTTQAGPKKAAPAAAVVEAKEEKLDVDGQTYTPYHVLIGKNLPADVDKTKKEDYLSPQEFQKYLKMSREEFKALRAWKQKKLKQAAGLF